MDNTERFLAHIASDGREQTVSEHLEGTARLCAAFAAAFDAAPQGQLAGLAHDLGKFSQAFQRRLHGGPKVDHATAGAWECCCRQQPCAAFAVIGHHSGLPDGGAQTDLIQSTFWARINRAAAGELEDYSAWTKELTLPGAPPPATKDPAGLMFFTRMLYSCLTDADFLDTEAFMDGAPRETGGDSIAELDARLQAYLQNWFPPQNALNRERRAILQRCMEQGSAQQSGLFTLTVPTGGGKTIASLAFALRHAKANGLRRIVYVVPYTSIIEQNADVFRGILGAENVLEHHSGVLFDSPDEMTPEALQWARATENWDMPVVVTTAVQFFESLFSNRSSGCRKLHNLAGSVIVFDEAQMLPIPYLRPCVYAIAELVKHYHVSAVLCTATQPALDGIFRQFLPDSAPRELCTADIYCMEPFRRVSFRQVGRLSWESLAAQISACGQALCIVNSRKAAETLFALLQPEGAFHLSTLMFPAHRRAVLAEIGRRLEKGLPCRVVSTSLIEAGVDVDFPAVFREQAGLDSLLQAAGRCNRNGKLPAGESVVTIFIAPEAPPRMFEQTIRAGKETLSHFASPEDPQAVRFYFERLLSMKDAGELDGKGILPLMERELFPFCSVAERFHLIDTDTKTIYIPLGEGEALIRHWADGERSRRLLRRLGQYAVSVYPEHFSALYAAGALQMYDKGKTAVLSDLTLYDSKTGLSLKADTGKAMFV